ncbi:MAG: hypothetical protein ACYTJ0_02970 [Planctomycetota bacterium]|jgi:hypothetical protein
MYCRSCHYRLDGLPAGKCPECARGFDPADPTSYEELPPHRKWLQYPVGIGSAAVLGTVWLGYRTGTPPFFLLAGTASAILGIAGVVSGMRRRPAAPSPGITVLAMLPSIAMLGLFYSLAVHMHRSLGAWPAAIGTRGFAPSLETHAGMASGCFGIQLLVNLLALPVALLLCASIRRWRTGLFYLGVYALSYSVGFVLMLLAPSPFLNWWWD